MNLANVTPLPIGKPAEVLENLTDTQVSTLAGHTLSLINLTSTDTNRGTHYSTKEEFEQARESLHREVFVLDRSIYGCVFCLGGVTDFSKQQAVMTLLSNPWSENGAYVLSPLEENQILDKLIYSLPANRMMNLFRDFRGNRVNNSRTRWAILPKILNSGNLELWSVKYRRKMKNALEHALNKRTTSIIKSILTKDMGKWSTKEHRIIDERLRKFYSHTSRGDLNVLECVSFALGNDLFMEKPYSMRLFKKFQDAREDLNLGKGLPPEVLEGIRSTYHTDVQKEKILDLTKDTLTAKQAKSVQKRAKAAGVKVAFDPNRYPIVDLFIYAYEMGWTDAIGKAIAEKAKKAARGMPIRYNRIGVLIDDSFSMTGSKQQAMRPISIALATRDMLANVAKDVDYATASGRDSFPDNKPLIRPSGPTSLSRGLITLLKQSPDAVFILSDGYENAPAGRTAELMDAVRKIGIKTPIYMFNPVASAESGEGIRSLGDKIMPLPISTPENVGALMFKAALEADPRRGLLALVGTVFPKLLESKGGGRIAR